MQRLARSSLRVFSPRRAAGGNGAASNGDSHPHWQLARNGSNLFPASEDAMAWRIGNHGFEMTLSPRVPELIAGQLRPWIETWLSREGMALAEVQSWAIHPGGPRVVSQVAAALSLGDNAVAMSQQVLSEYGNMSSATILFILRRLMAQDAPRPCVALAFGPGAGVVISALFR